MPQMPARELCGAGPNTPRGALPLIYLIHNMEHKKDQMEESPAPKHQLRTGVEIRSCLWGLEVVSCRLEANTFEKVLDHLVNETEGTSRYDVILVRPLP